MSNCPICDGDSFEAELVQTDTKKGHCRACGHIHVTKAAIEKIKGDNNCYLLSAFFRRWKEGPAPLVTADNLDELLKKVFVDSPLGIMNSLLLLLAKGTAAAKGQYSTFDSTYDYPLLAIRPEEVEFYMDGLERRGLIVKGPSTGTVTIDGWEHVSRLQPTGSDSIIVFVAMSFEKQWEDYYYKSIKPAIEDAGYVPVRMDLLDHAHKIDDEMLSWVKKSKFMVADFSGGSGGVYFEAGLMVGLCKDVIWTCRKDRMTALHFNTNHYNYLSYETIDEFKDSLYNRIIKIEGPARQSEKADSSKI